MDALKSFTIEPETMTWPQLLWAFVTYGYVLFTSANMIGDGSELLLLIPSLAGIVGSIVLPILGAVPDGMMVLFSGLGELCVAQEQVSVGVGALAGSTIMLLTIPWFLAIVGGRVDIEKGEAMYSKRGQKLTKPLLDLQGTGIEYDVQVPNNAKIMVLTALTYFVIQIPALLVDNQEIFGNCTQVKEVTKESKFESWAALSGLVLCIIFFAAYLFLQYQSGKKTQKSSDVTVVKSAYVDLGYHYRDAPDVKAKLVMDYSLELYIQKMRDDNVRRGSKPGQTVSERFIESADFDEDVKVILSQFYAQYSDSKTKSISYSGFTSVINDVGLQCDSKKISEMFRNADKDKSGTIDKQEFFAVIKELAAHPPKQEEVGEQKASVSGNAADDDEDEDEEEMPEEFKDLPVDQQRKRILLSSFWQMGLGTLLVLIFSDPMVDVLAEMGHKSGVPAFYISFVLAPLASNASELIAAFKYASKKTKKTITISLNTLEGAACMNNTFCLGIFFALICFQGLAWKFTAETLAIFFVQVIMALLVLTQKQQTMLTAFIILAIFPLCLLAVYVLQNVIGID